MELLLCVAVVPGLLLLWFVYKKDPIEKEPMGLLISLLVLGVVSAFLAMVLEELGYVVLNPNEYTYAGLFLANFGIVAVSEEASKFLFLRIRTWKSKEFDYLFDGIVYAVFVSLGFAIFENILYTFEYGLSTGIMRAFTSLPGHTVFAVYMGYFYGMAKGADYEGNVADRRKYLVLSLVVPMAAHGTYDFLLSVGSTASVILFFALITSMFLLGLRMINKLSREARRIAPVPVEPVLPTVPDFDTMANQLADKYVPPANSNNVPPSGPGVGGAGVGVGGPTAGVGGTGVGGPTVGGPTVTGRVENPAYRDSL